jgi:hypothetical protein
MAGNVRKLRGPTILLEVYDLLDGLPYQASANTGEVPTVYFLDADENRNAERIELSGQLQDGDVEWNSTGALVEETVTVEILIYAGDVGQTGSEALSRAISLCETVQDGFRDSTTGRPTGITTAGVIGNYRIAGYQVESFPVIDEGWGVKYVLQLRVTARG